MNTSTILGIIVGLATLMGGMILKGSSLSALVNPAALVIIFVGTFAALLNAFPMSTIAKLPTYFKLIFTASKQPKEVDIAKEFCSLAQTARRDGILALEKMEFKEPFLKLGASMLVDGVDPEVLEDVMEQHLEAMEERHRVGAQVFAQAGMYAPTLGVMGAVIGLVAALGNLNDIEKLGHSIAAAFIATLFGIFSGYVLWHPFSNKLKQMSAKEVEIKRMIISGIKAIQNGESIYVIQERMLAFLQEKDREILRKEWEK